MNKNFQHLTQYHCVGITGVIGSGKTFLAQYLQSCYQANIIEIDDIRRNMLWISLSQQSIQLRKELIQAFSIEQYDSDFFFDRKNFTHFIFSDIALLSQFNSICQPYFKEVIKSQFLSQQLNCIIWVNLIEDNYLDMIDYMIFIDILQHKWELFNQQQILVKERFTMQLDFLSKKRLLNNLLIPYEVFNNE